MILTHNTAGSGLVYSSGSIKLQIMYDTLLYVENYANRIGAKNKPALLSLVSWRARRGHKHHDRISRFCTAHFHRPRLMDWRQQMDMRQVHAGWPNLVYKSLQAALNM